MRYHWLIAMAIFIPMLNAPVSGNGVFTSYAEALIGSEATYIKQLC